MAKFNAETKIWEATSVAYPYSMDTFLGEVILNSCNETPNRVIQIHHEEESSLRCHELKVSSIKIAQNLIAIGIKPDDVIGLICRNSNFVTCFLTGSILMGGIVHPLDHSLSADNMSQLYGHSQPKLIICDLENLSSLQDALGKINIKPMIYVTEKDGDEEEGFPSAFDLLNSSGDVEKFVTPKFNQSADKKLCAILCSSGVTGLQKGVCISHATCLRFDFKSYPKPPSRPLTFSSAYWSSGFFLHIFAAFYPNDIRIWSSDDFNVDKLVEIIDAHKISGINLAPSSLAALLNSDFFISSNHECCSTFVVIGSMFSDSLRQKFRKTFPTKLLMTGYGMTEVFISLSKPNECYRGMTVGSMITPNLRLKIVNKKGESVNPGEYGEIRVKTQFKFLGYYKDSDATNQALDSDGYIKTGDIGYFDEDGSLYIVDRIKEAFKYKNYAIFPSEIENVIQSIDGVELVCVVPIFNENLCTDLATAVIKKSPSSQLDENFIINYVGEVLPEVKQLYGGVFFMDDMPLTPSGKVQKKIVKDLIVSMLRRY